LSRLFVGRFFNGDVKFYVKGQLLLYRQCSKISQPQGARTRSYVIFDQF